MNTIDQSWIKAHASLLLAIGLAALLIPWLGLTLFNTKGEPREAIVAVSMLQSGDWVLPVSYGADIPYKPPFLAWLIAIFSIIFNGGEVSEFTSRLPSALAAIAMVTAGMQWLRKAGKPTSFALAAALITITSFEVYRAAVACRVDMVLTCCMVIALYQMYNWRQCHAGTLGAARFLFIILLLSGAVLTKGPVGALLPCLAMGLYCLLRGDNFFKTVGWLSAVAILSMAIPAVWYWKAYQAGAQHFFDLAYEENIGRLIGKMGYSSHLNPWPYNIVTIVAGMLPWTLLAIFALFSLKTLCAGKIGKHALLSTTRSLSEPAIFAITVAVTVFVFYCFPASKRSVYLLPMYPFMAYGIASVMFAVRRCASYRLFARIVFILAVATPICAIAAQWLAPAKLNLQHIAPWAYVPALLPVALGAMAIAKRLPRMRYLLGCMTAIYLAYGSAFQPMALNSKSDKHALERIATETRDAGPIYSFIPADSLIRYYTLNYYMGDKLLRYDPAQHQQMPQRWCVLSSADDLDALREAFAGMQCDTACIARKSCDTRSSIVLSKFHR